MIDLLFTTYNRLDFVRASVSALLAHTDWSRVRRVLVYDEESSDGTAKFMQGVDWPSGGSFLSGQPGGPVAIMNHYLQGTPASVFAKIDSDTIVPPGWLDACSDTFELYPSLDLLGIEPPASRTPHRVGMKRNPPVELDPGQSVIAPGTNRGYAICDSIGGIGLMRTCAFLAQNDMRHHSIYGGFTEWQLKHQNVKKGWIVPPLAVFLLDRMITEPWRSLSLRYNALGWQREWSPYDPEDHSLWDWWKPTEVLHDSRSVAQRRNH